MKKTISIGVLALVFASAANAAGVTGNDPNVFPQVVCNGFQFAAGVPMKSILQNEVINIPSGPHFETERAAEDYKLNLAYVESNENILGVTLIDKNGNQATAEFRDFNKIPDLVTQKTLLTKNGSGVGIACTLQISKDSKLPGSIN
jgi:hypothetical protein